MNNELWKIIGAFGYAFIGIALPAGIILGIFGEGYVKWVAPVLAITFSSVAYVLASLNKEEKSFSEILKEILFWLVSGVAVWLFLLSYLESSWLTTMCSVLVAFLTYTIWHFVGARVRKNIVSQRL